MRENNCFAIGVGRNDSVSSHICPKSGQTRCRHRNKRTKKNPRYPARELKYFRDTDTRACKPSNHFTMTGHFLFWIVIEWKELTFFYFFFVWVKDPVMVADQEHTAKKWMNKGQTTPGFLRCDNGIIMFSIESVIGQIFWSSCLSR